MKKIVFAALAALSLVACGSSISQSADCKKYIECYEATGGTKGSLDSSYGTSGTCWTTTQVAADSCTAACKSAIDALKTSYPDQAECK